MSTTPDPIRLPFAFRNVLMQGDIFRSEPRGVDITPDIARQIVALAGIPRLDTDFIVSTDERLAALEAENMQDAEEDDKLEQRIAALEKRIGGEQGDGKPSGDDAAVRALACVIGNTTGDMTACAIQTLASIRSGEVPLPEDAPQIAALRAKLAATEISGSQAIDRLRAERDDLAKRLADAEKDKAFLAGQVREGERIAGGAIAERDRLAADLRQRDENQAMQETVITKLNAERDRITAQVAGLDCYIRRAYEQEFESDYISPVQDLLRHMFVTLAERGDNRKAAKQVAELEREIEGEQRGAAEHMADRDRLAAQVAELTREREEARQTQKVCCNIMQADRDRALADLAAEQSAHASTREQCNAMTQASAKHYEQWQEARAEAERAKAECNRLSNKYDEMTKSGSIDHLRKLNGEANAARAEADAAKAELAKETQAKFAAITAAADAVERAEAAKAELHVTKLSVSEWHADAERLSAELAALKARKVRLPQRFAIDAVEGHDRSGYPEAQLEIEKNDAGAWIHYSETADAIRAAGVEVSDE